MAGYGTDSAPSQNHRTAPMLMKAGAGARWCRVRRRRDRVVGVGGEVGGSSVAAGAGARWCRARWRGDLVISIRGLWRSERDHAQACMARLSSPFEVQRRNCGGGGGQHLEDSGESVVVKAFDLSHFGPTWHGFSTRQPTTQTLPQHPEKAQRFNHCSSAFRGSSGHQRDERRPGGGLC